MGKKRTIKSINPVEYAAWNNMIHRCHVPHHKAYPDYGGRGIVVCPEWRYSFDQFLADMGNKPDPSLSLDRLDNDGPYSKSNCAWRTRREQQCNRRGSAAIQTITPVTWQGRTQALWQWAEELGLDIGTLKYRLRIKLPLDRAMTPGKLSGGAGRRPKLHEWQGRRQSAKHWADELGVAPHVVLYRIKAGLNIDGSKKLDPLVASIDCAIAALDRAVSQLSNAACH